MVTDPTAGEKPDDMFHCTNFGGLDMPVDKQRGFCAIQFRKGRDNCIDCVRGKTAAKETAEDVRSSLPPTTGDASRAGMRAAEIKKSKGSSNKEAKMADKKLCSCGCGKGAVKDGLATKCYRKKYGKAPFSKGQEAEKGPAKEGRSGQVKKRSSPGAKSRDNRMKGNGSHAAECEGCKTLQLQLDDLDRAEKIMVAAGLVTAERFEQARSWARELHK
jgi:hypothetical protein